MSDKILIIGAGGQIGTELLEGLNAILGSSNVIAADLKNSDVFKNNAFEVLDIMDKDNLFNVVKKHQINQIYLLAALLSATAEKNPKLGWNLNMDGLFNVLDLAKEKIIDKVYWPSSIAVFGHNTPKVHTPQFTIMEPSTVYGISKQAGERWCEYYFKKYNVDVRSLRYPGLIGWKSAPGGGTTDYAVHIFHQALEQKNYECFLTENTTLPMMYMPDAIKATIDIMNAPANDIIIRSSYNLSGVSFSPREIAHGIKQHIPEFTIKYKPDFRQDIADSWPHSIDDSHARADWGWKPKYNLEAIIEDMFVNLKNNTSLNL
jgi:nucleoside-diphosphate-sugar epimerase